MMIPATSPIEIKHHDRTSPLLSSLKQKVERHRLIVIANREPYIHQHRLNRIEIMHPASGVVAALEPLLRECGGLWLAHGSGNADRETSDSNGEIQVPPEHPQYTLKRLWLTPEEEFGYYYGFSNEGLWPLCHLAHQRPLFRLSDWQQYWSVNQRFCQALPRQFLYENSLILIQDYHFALLPRMLKEDFLGRTQKKISLFWHIPWPNPETFGICPWHKEVLKGMLGADLIGFHTQNHCNNFLESCDRYLEARIDWEKFSVTMEKHETLVRSFPIGIHLSEVRKISQQEREKLKYRYGIHSDLIAIGVDRLDYTKGIIERIEAIERFLEKYPQYIGRFTFAQIGAPSRTSIPAYQSLAKNLHQEIDKVNSRFGFNTPEGPYQPIVLLARHHEWDEIQLFYQLGDLCLVTSLHDGMNLVAKEYIWCQDVTRGALILSKFTGASREMTEALIVNPYSTEEMADAIATAILFSPEERVRRMQAMKEKVEKQNAFQWASDIIQTLIG